MEETSKKQVAYLTEMQNTLFNFLDSVKRLNSTLEKSHQIGIDVNDFILEKYPFTQSVEDLRVDVQDWIDKSISTIGEHKEAIITQ